MFFCVVRKTLKTQENRILLCSFFLNWTETSQRDGSLPLVFMETWTKSSEISIFNRLGFCPNPFFDDIMQKYSALKGTLCTFLKS